MEQCDNSERKVFSSFSEFYPFYLEQHANKTCRRLHVVGTGMVILVAATVLVSGLWWLLPVTPVVGYGFAWVGHFFFEKNKPAAFGNPVYSLMGDFVMFKDVLTRKITW